MAGNLERSASHRVRPRARAFDARVWLLAIGAFAVSTDLYIVSGLLPALSRDFHIEVGSATLVVTSYSLTYAVAAPVLAACTARFTGKFVVGAAMLLYAICNLLCALAPGFDTLIAARVAAGVAGGTYAPAAYALAASLAAEGRRGAALSAVGFGLSFATVLGLPIGNQIGHWYGWRAAFVFIAIVSVVAAVALLLSMPRARPPASSAVPLRARFAPLVDGRTLLALLPNLAWYAGILGFYSFLGASFAEARFSVAAVTAIFFVYGIGALTGSRAGGPLADRFGAARVIAVTLLVAIVDLAAFELIPAGELRSAIAVFFLGLTGWTLFPAQQARLVAISDPANVQVVLALNSTTLYLGLASGTALGAALLAHGVGVSQLHWFGSVWLLAALAIFGASCAAESQRPRAAQPSN
jgi:MFS transporter, DHA1 family, inner membrane transport protein